MIILKTVCRTLFYQFFLIFIGLSIGVICNAEWLGWKSNLVQKSIENIFYPTEFNEKTCQQVKNWGRFRVWAFNNSPENFTVVEDGLLGEEFYICKFTYTDLEGKEIEKIDSTRVRWKTWEYYYTDPSPWEEKDIRKYLDDENLNSKESEKAYRLYGEWNNSKFKK